eukprot:8293736-Karenia_brevis.AAC.1
MYRSDETQDGYHFVLVGLGYFMPAGALNDCCHASHTILQYVSLAAGPWDPAVQLLKLFHPE